MDENKEETNNLPMILGIVLVACLLLMIFIVPNLVESNINSGSTLRSPVPTQFGLSDTFKLVE